MAEKKLGKLGEILSAAVLITFLLAAIVFGAKYVYSAAVRPLWWRTIAVSAYASADDRAHALGVPPPIIEEMDKTDLGKPIGPIQRVSKITVEKYDHGTVIWVPDRFFVIYDAPRDGVVTAQEVSDSEPESDPKWFDDAYLRTYTGTPRNKCPADGGFAHVWSSLRGRLGYRLSRVEFNGGVFIRQFARGVKIGPLPVNSEVPDQSRLFSIDTTDRRYSAVRLSTVRPPIGERGRPCQSEASLRR